MRWVDPASSDRPSNAKSAGARWDDGVGGRRNRQTHRVMSCQPSDHVSRVSAQTTERGGIPQGPSIDEQPENCSVRRLPSGLVAGRLIRHRHERRPAAMSARRLGVVVGAGIGGHSLGAPCRASTALEHQSRDANVTRHKRLKALLKSAAASGVLSPFGLGVKAWAAPRWSRLPAPRSPRGSLVHPLV
jgi:hypothetical protein